MEFRCERDVLAEALKSASRAVGRHNGALPALACLHLAVAGDALTVEATDLELAVAVDVTVAGQADGAFACPARILTDAVSSLPSGAVVISAVDEKVTITSGRSAFELRTVDESEFPRLAWPTGEAPTIPAKEFLAAVARVVPSASTDDSRPILRGVLLQRIDDSLRLVATDSYRLTYEDLPHGHVLGGTTSALVPAAALGALAKVAPKGGDVTVYLTERTAVFVVGDLRLSARLIEGEFPNYGGLIPKSHQGRLVANRVALLEDVKRAKILARESTPVRLNLGAGGTLLGAVTQDVGSASIDFDAGYDGPELVVAFNPDYFLDALEAAPGDEVHLDVIDGRNPAVLRSPGADQFLALLMPVRVS